MMPRTSFAELRGVMFKALSSALVLVLLPALASAQDCARVATTLKLPDATVTSASVVAAADGLPAYCRVQLTIKPSE